MKRKKLTEVPRAARILRALPLAAAVGVLVVPLNALSAEVEHVTLEIADNLGVPAVQAQIVACLGEEVFFTGTVRITIKDGVETHFNWAGMRGATLDGDVFVGGSGVNVGQQANLTLVEVGRGPNKRQVHLHNVLGNVWVTCNV